MLRTFSFDNFNTRLFTDPTISGITRPTIFNHSVKIRDKLCMNNLIKYNGRSVQEDKTYCPGRKDDLCDVAGAQWRSKGVWIRLPQRNQFLRDMQIIVPGLSAVVP